MVYTATNAGTVYFSNNAVGYNEANKATVTAGATWSNPVVIEDVVAFDTQLFALPTTASVGQFITVIMVVTNTGDADAEAALAATPVASVPADVSLLSSPASVLIAGNSGTNFTWTFSAAASGNINFAGLMYGYDENTKVTITANDISNNITIQNPATLASYISTYPTTVKANEDLITVIMTVTNTGGATISNVVPTLSATGSSIPMVDSIPISMNVTITAGAAYNFTWTFSGDGVGNLIFTGYATGTDANSGVVAGTTGNTSLVNVVSNLPVMTASMSALPTDVTINQRFTVIMQVDNVGLVDAYSVTVPAALNLTAGTATSFGGPFPTAQTITAGTSGYFTWIYTAGATAGLITVEASAQELVTGQSTALVNASVTAYDPPNFSTYNLMILEPVGGTVSVGQKMTLTMTISNTGDTDAVNIAPVFPLTRIGTGNATIFTSPLPALQSIATGSAATFTWVYTATAPGNIALYGFAEGEDVRTGNVYQSLTGTSNTLLIESPPALTSDISILGSTLNLGQEVTVIMTVTNSGLADATGVTPGNLFITTASTGGMIPPLPPDPLFQDINAGATQSFTWTFSATGQGSVALSGNATGTDQNSFLSVSSPMTESPYVYIQLPGSIISNIWASPSTVKTGEIINVYMEVSNTGGADVVANTPTAIGITGTILDSYILSGPVPANASSIPSGSAFTFTWTYSATAGDITFDGSADGFDLNTGIAVASGNTSSNTVTINDSAFLAVETSLSSSVVSTGQYIEVIMTVTNNGTAATLDGVTPSVSVISTGGAVYTPVNPIPVASAPIPAGGTASFTWIYNPTSAGTLAFSTYVTYENIDGVTDTTPELTGQVEIQETINLIADLYGPTSVNVGQTYDITMVVTNTGGATANFVAFQLTLSETGGGSTPGPFGGSSTIAGGGNSEIYTFQYVATGSGLIYFSGNATGTDSNNGAFIDDTGWTNKHYVSVEAPASLSVTAFTVYPPVVSISQNVTVMMTVSNGGEGLVDNVVPSLTFTGAGASLVPISGPNPALYSFGANEEITFTWTYSAAGAGTFDFSGGASGLERNTNVSIETGPTADERLEIINQQAILTSELIINPNPIGVNQNLTILLSVTNTGLKRATGVDVTALEYPAPHGDWISNTITSPISVVDLNIGASTVFTWIYTTTSVTYSAGTMVFTVSAIGLNDDLCPSVNCFNVTTTAQNSTEIVQPPELASWITALPSVVNVGSNVTIVMSVSNYGIADAINVVPTQLYMGGSGATNPNNPSSPIPGSATIPGNGGLVTFTWVVSADVAGDISWLGWATGKDINTLALTQSIPTNSNTIIIEEAALLVIDNISAPSYVSIGQWFTVTMLVSNQGDATANNVNVPSGLSVAGGGGVTPIFSPIAVNIPGDSAVTLTWTFSAGGSGIVQLSGYASGTDANSFAVVNSLTKLSGQIRVETAADLTATLQIDPNINYNGEVFKVVMAVANSGQADALGVSITSAVGSPFEIDPWGPIPPSAFVVGAPSPVSRTVAGMNTEYFTWTYSASGDGLVTFTGFAIGTDENSGFDLITAVSDDTITINASAALSAEMSVSDMIINVGQSVTVIMTITNTGVGASNAYNVEPIGDIWAGDPTMTLTSGPDTVGPVPVTLAVGAAVSYTWEYAGTSSGTSFFSAVAQGLDVPGVITSVPLLSGAVVVQDPGALVSSITVTDTQINTGTQITVVMSVQNTGDAEITGVTPIFYISPADNSVGNLNTGPSPASYASVTGGVSVEFTWLYDTPGAGTFDFSGNATGIDVNDTFAETSPNTFAPSTVVQDPATLTSYITTIPPVGVSVSQVITVVMSVSNFGDADATGVEPLLVVQNDNGSGAAVTLIGSSDINGIDMLTPITIAGNSSGSFTWTYTTTAQGEMTFSAAATGTDFNSTLIVSSAQVGHTTLISEPSATLIASLNAFYGVEPVPLNTVGGITVVMTVSNVGLADARTVSLTAFAVTPGGDVFENSGPIVGTMIDRIAVGSSYDFIWVYDTLGNPGTINFTAVAIGWNDVSGNALPAGGVSAEDDIIIRPSGAAFDISISAPVAASIGDAITVIMQMTNTGQLEAFNVYPDPSDLGLLVGGSGVVTVASSPSNTNVAIAQNANHMFTWVYTAVAGGDVAFSGGLYWEYYNQYTGVTETTRTFPTSYLSSGVVTIEFGTSTTDHDDMYLSTNSFDPTKGESVDIVFSVKSAAANSELIVFNVAGERVRTIPLGPVNPGTYYNIPPGWDGRADDGMLVTTGLYFIKLNAGAYQETRTVAVIKQ